MANGQTAGFDVDAARKAGYSDDEILEHLTATRKFDIAGALQAGYAKADIIGHLAGTASAPPPEPELNLPGEAGFPQGEPGNRELGKHAVIAAALPIAGAGIALAPEAAAAIATRPWWLGGTAAAGKAIQQAQEKAGSMTVAISDKMSKALDEATSIKQAGGYMPQAMRQFIQRVTDPEKPPLNFEQARRFYVNAAALSRDEAAKIAKGGPSAFQFYRWKDELASALREVANDAGLPEYARGMKDYARAKAMQEWVSKIGVRIGQGIGIGAGATLGGEMIRRGVKAAYEEVAP